MTRTHALPALLLLLSVSGCGRSPRVAGPPAVSVRPVAPTPDQPVPASPGAVEPGQPVLETNAAFEEGQASWYGDPYHGRQSASGEVFDKNKLTAAHRTLAFDTWVRVENQTNGRTVDVRINDRGPFVEGRVIDLSEAAAREIDMIRAGVVPVGVSILQTPDRARNPSGNDVFYVVQLGAFREAANARDLVSRLSDKYTGIYVEPPTRSGSLHVVLIGRALLSDARSVQGRLMAEEGIDSIVVQVAE
jgi:rare lipoprotein A